MTIDLLLQEKEINTVYEQIKDLDKGMLTSGLMILAKDMAEYVAPKGFNDLTTLSFQEAYTGTMSLEREYWDVSGNDLFKPLSQINQPFGFAMKAENNDFDISALQQKSIHHEWLSNPGSHLFDKFKEKFKEVICGKDGPYKKLEDGLTEESEMVKTIAGTILAGVAATNVWVSISVYVAMLIVKTGLKVYCEK